jgi:hypothetical protein
MGAWFEGACQQRCTLVARLFQRPSSATSQAYLIRGLTYIISCTIAADNQLQSSRLQQRQLRCLSVVCPCHGNRPSRYRGSSSGYGDLRNSESASSESRGRDESRAEHGWEVEVRARGRWSCACVREKTACDVYQGSFAGVLVVRVFGAFVMLRRANVV